MPFAPHGVRPSGVTSATLPSISLYCTMQADGGSHEVCRPDRWPCYSKRDAGIPGRWQNVAVTVRIPENMRDAAKEAAELNGVSFTALLKMSLIEYLSKDGR